MLIQTLSSLVMTYLHRYHKSKEGRNKDSITEQCCLYCAALLLGCKTLESLRTMRDIFNSVASVMWRDSDASQLDRTYTSLKPRLIEKEHELLRILRFDVEFELPHKYLLNMARHINMTQSSVQLAWGMLTDAFILPESILTKPEVLAAAALCLAFAVHNQPTSDKDSSVNTELFQRVCSVFALDSKEIMSTVCWMSQGLCNASSCNWFNA